MKSGTYALPLPLLLLAACQADDRTTLDSVIQHHSDARGGEQAIESVQAIRLELEISEPGFTVHGDYVATRDGHMRIDIFAGDERVFTEAVGPDGGWQLLQAATEATELSEDGESALKRGLVENLYGLHERADLGYELSLAGSISRDGEDFWVIDQVAPDGFSKRLYLDSSSYLVMSQIETSALHPDLDSTKTQQQTYFSEHRPAAGALIPRRTEKIDSESGEVVQTVIVRNVEINPEIDTTVFDRIDEPVLAE